MIASSYQTWITVFPHILAVNSMKASQRARVDREDPRRDAILEALEVDDLQKAIEYYSIWIVAMEKELGVSSSLN